MDPAIEKEAEAATASGLNGSTENGHDRPVWNLTAKPEFSLPPGVEVDYDKIAEEARKKLPVWNLTAKPEFSLPPGVEVNYDEYITEDNTPVDSPFVDWQYTLLREPLETSWPSLGCVQPFVAVANVGLYAIRGDPAIVPDFMVSVGVQFGSNNKKKNRSYFCWKMGKPPDLAIEIVSDREGGEEDRKVERYAQIGVPYYVIFDPDQHLNGDVLRSFELVEGKYQPLLEHRYPKIKLGLTLLQETYVNMNKTWLRWVDESGTLIETGAEAARKLKQRADQEKQRADKLAAQLRALGIDPET